MFHCLYRQGRGPAQRLKLLTNPGPMGELVRRGNGGDLLVDHFVGMGPSLLEP